MITYMYLTKNKIKGTYKNKIKSLYKMKKAFQILSAGLPVRKHEWA